MGEKAKPHDLTYQLTGDAGARAKYIQYTRSALQSLRKACASFEKLNAKDISALSKKIDYQTLKENFAFSCPLAKSGSVEKILEHY